MRLITVSLLLLQFVKNVQQNMGEKFMIPALVNSDLLT